MQQISVGLIYYNEADKVENCLRSLFSSSNLKYMHELIVVFNSQPSERVFNLFLTYQANFPTVQFQFLYNFKNNLGESRRKIVNTANSQFLCFTDPDCEVSGSWLAEFYDRFLYLQKKDIHCVGLNGLTKLKLGDQKSFEGSLQGKWVSLRSPQTWQVAGEERVDHVQTSNSFFVVEALKKVGNFSLAYKKSGEDLEMGLRLGKNGYSQYLCSVPIVRHSPTASLLEWLVRCGKLGEGQLNPYLGERFLHKALVIVLFLFIFIFRQPIFFSFGLLFLILFYSFWQKKSLVSSFLDLVYMTLSAVCYGAGVLKSFFHRVWI